MYALLLLAVARPSTAIQAADPHVRYIGRWDMRDANGPRCEWPASAVELRFRDGAVAVNLSPSKDWWSVELDGKPVAKFSCEAGGEFPLTDGPLRGAHTVRLVKDTESFIGVGQVRGFSLDGAKLLDKPHAPKHGLEVIGDSISCGFGDEGKKQTEPFMPSTENGDMAYGAVAARELGADYTCIAWSGRKMWPDNTIPSIYDLTLPTDPASAWGFGVRPPDAIVINLATNDFGREVPDEKGWTGAYADFIGHLREFAPKARIYLAIGTMMSDGYPQGRHDVTTLRGYLQEVADLRAKRSDLNVAIIDFGSQDVQHDGVGSAWHPNLVTHQKMADKLAAQIKQDLSW